MASFWIDNLTNKDELLLKQRRFDEPAPLLLSRTLGEANSGEVARHPSWTIQLYAYVIATAGSLGSVFWLLNGNELTGSDD